MTTRTRRLAGVLFAAILVAAGCGGGDDSGDNAANTVPPTVERFGDAGDIVLDSSELPTTTTGPRDAPQGKVTYAFNTAFSPSWLDPQENPATATPYLVVFAVHDALVRHLPGQTLAPSLASSYEMADDFTSATFTLREGITFHDGTPITPEDVKFTYENYRGGNAALFKEMTERVETPDDRTIRFVFKRPFLDFMLFYGSPVSGAGWVVPKDYYLRVGPDGFKQNPIGAGPYKFVSSGSGSELTLEAFPEYWRRSPGVETLVIKFMPDNATRFAGTLAGEIDMMTNLPGTLYQAARGDPWLTVHPTAAGVFWLEMPGWERPDSPFHDVRVRKAVSLALDRRANSDAEAAGLVPVEGTWIPENFGGSIPPAEVPEAWRTDVEEAKRLMAEAGYPDGFSVSQLTPFPGFNSLGERVIGQLAQIGIRTSLNQMERAAFLEAATKGVDALPGLILIVTSAPGDAASRIRAYATCEGSSSRTCIPEVEEKFAAYETSTDTADRSRLITEIQQLLLDQSVFPFVYTQTNLTVTGHRVANEMTEIWGAIPQWPVLGPYEDVELKPGS